MVCKMQLVNRRVEHGPSSKHGPGAEQNKWYYVTVDAGLTWSPAQNSAFTNLQELVTAIPTLWVQAHEMALAVPRYNPWLVKIGLWWHNLQTHA